MVSPALAVDVPPQPWTGRFDGDGAEHRRWWQAVTPYAPRTVRHRASRPAPAAVILGFGSDAGVRRNKGRTGAAAAPAAIRAALGPLAFHLDRDVHDAGDVTVRRRTPWRQGRHAPGSPSPGCSTPGSFPWCWAAGTRPRSPATSAWPVRRPCARA